MDVPLSDSDIVARRPNLLVVKYSELPRNLAEMLAKGQSIVVLYESRENEGHWVLIHTTTPGNIEFFDPYGSKPDTEFCHIKRKFRKMSGQDQPKILDALMRLKNSGFKIHYNQFRIQKLKPGINTCGRWCILRDKYGAIPIKSFYKQINKIADKNNVSRDQVVVNLVP